MNATTYGSVLTEHESKIQEHEKKLAIHDENFEELRALQERCSIQHRRSGEQLQAMLVTQNVANETNVKILAALEEQAKFNERQAAFNAEQCAINKEQSVTNSEQLKYTKIIATATTTAKINWQVFTYTVAFVAGCGVIAGAWAAIKNVIGG